MRLTTALFFFHLSRTSAFAPPAATSSTIELRALADVPPAGKKVLTASDVVAKSAARAEEDAEEIPKLFAEDIYNDFQSALLKLEKRVKDGKGSLTLEEVGEFEGETMRIVEEMK